VKTRKLHKITGLILLAPFIAWSLTAVFFLVRPGYEEAYERPQLKQYPLEAGFSIPANAAWTEVRLFNTILGKHLIVKESGTWRHLDGDTLEEKPYPSETELRLLLEEAFSFNPERYGSIATIDDIGIHTTTGVDITLDWNTLSIFQNGKDTRAIDQIYSIHYLEWTGIEILDRIVGLSGLFLLIYMTWSGMQLAFGWDRKNGSEKAMAEELA